MYPYSVVLLGTAEGLAGLELLLANRAARLLGKFPDLRTFRSAKPATQNPLLFIVQLRNEEDLQHLRLLSDSCPGEPIIALVEGDCDVNVLFSISRSGASQLVSCPFSDTDLLAAFDRVTRQFGRVPPAAKLVSVCGAVGGAGATTLALNFGIELATRWEKSCLLAEPTVPFGRLASYLDVPSPRSTKEVFYATAAPDLNQLQHALTPVYDRLQLLAAPSPSFPVRPATGERVLSIVNDCRQLADLVILDLPGPFSEMDFQLVSLSDEVLLVSDASVPGLQALQLIRDAVSHRRGSGPLRIVINRAPSGMDIAHLKQVMKAETVWALPDDPRGVPQSVDKGGPVRAYAPDSPVLTEMNRLLTALFGPPSSNIAPGSLLRRWMARG